MREGDDLKLVQIAVTDNGLYRLTGHEDVWRFDNAATLWKPLPMGAEQAVEASARSR